MIELIGGWLQDLVLPGLGTLLIGAAFGLVRKYVQQLNDDRLRRLLLELVRAAEQIYGPGNGEAKRVFVESKLRESGYPTVAREKIEAAVYGLDGAGA